LGGNLVDVHHAQALELITGRWKSQILHAGVKLGILESVGEGSTSSADVAAQQSLDTGNTYRLMRALASIGVLEETTRDTFQLTTMGECFLSANPASLRDLLLWEEGEMLYRIWSHLPEIVRDGGEDGNIREFGLPVFEYLASNEGNAALFANAMTSYSKNETTMVLEALSEIDFSGVAHLCDIGGGQGHLLCHLLQAYPQLRGTVLELAVTLEDESRLLAGPMGLADRCAYVEGDMFSELPAADAYITKHILHDWNDEECIQILSTARRAGGAGSRLLIAEYVVPGPAQPDFSKLFDIHMMVALTGRERTESEFVSLLEEAGWKHLKTWRQPESTMAVVEGVAAP
jgi:hypothetical protein